MTGTQHKGQSHYCNAWLMNIDAILRLLLDLFSHIITQFHKASLHCSRTGVVLLKLTLIIIRFHWLALMIMIRLISIDLPPACRSAPSGTWWPRGWTSPSPGWAPAGVCGSPSLSCAGQWCCLSSSGPTSCPCGSWSQPAYSPPAVTCWDVKMENICLIREQNIVFQTSWNIFGQISQLASDHHGLLIIPIHWLAFRKALYKCN